MRLPFFRGHAHWRDMAGAYCDGELGARDASRLEAHLAACASCREIVAESGRLKAMLAGLQDVEAPRSFRLAPSMVEASGGRRAQAPPRPSYVTRAAQLTTGFAAAALAVVVIVDVAPSSGGDDDDITNVAPLSAQEQRLAAEDAAGGSTENSAPKATGTAQATGAAGTPSAVAGSQFRDATATEEPLDGQVGGAGVQPTPTPMPSPAPPATGDIPANGYRDPGVPAPGDLATETLDEDLAEADATSGALALTLETGESGEDGGSGLRVAESVLGGLLLLGAVTWAATWFARRRGSADSRG